MSQFSTIAQVKSANKAAGKHFFDRSAMRFFNSRIESSLLQGCYFITSERMRIEDSKKFSLRRVNADASIDTVGEFQGYNSIAAAKRAISSQLIAA